MKVWILILPLLLFTKPKPAYFIVIGDITCKACVIELHDFVHKKISKNNLHLAYRDKSNLIANQIAISYYKEVLPKAPFVLLKNKNLFIDIEKFPYLLKVSGKDTLRLPYDSLFNGEYLDTKRLRRFCAANN